MADSASRLARLKTLKSGLKAKQKASAVLDDDDLPSLDSMLEEDTASSASQSNDPGDDPESLSAYFEALGIVPDTSKAGSDNKPVTPPVENDPVTSVDDAPAVEKTMVSEKGREVDARDRWADPVREGDAFLSSFAGPDTAKIGGDEPSIDSLLDDAEEAKVPTDEPAVEKASDSERGLESEPLPESEIPDLGDVLNDLADDEDDLEEFGGDIDIEAFEREIARAQRTKAQASSAPSGGADESASLEEAPLSKTEEPHRSEKLDEGALSVFFDAGRAAMLEQVSKQMGCTVDDVVITAIDWYLDALFGEDGTMQDAGAGE